MLPDFIQNLLTMFADNALLLGATLALATLISEDAALLTGSLMAGHGGASVELVIISLVLGILGGDIGLYALGYGARRSAWLRKRVPVKAAARFREWLDGREAAVLFTSRFLPGTRLPTYLSFGFFELSLTRFIIVMTVAALVWVGGTVLVLSEIQVLLMQVDEHIGIALGAVFAVMFIFVIPSYVRRSRKLQAYNADQLEGGEHAR